ncbi:MAG TPA: ABC transporter permease subunit [Burkholderiales bacterium]|nr:ABC transporter permease subunit [Burkholderiales bacterium]
MGANAWQRFWRVTFPLSLPGVFSGSSLVFIPALGVFVIPEILGGTGDMLIGNLIKEQFLNTRDWPFGSTLSIMLTIAVLLIAWFTAKLGARRGHYV